MLQQTWEPPDGQGHLPTQVACDYKPLVCIELLVIFKQQKEIQEVICVYGVPFNTHKNIDSRKFQEDTKVERIVS